MLGGNSNTLSIISMDITKILTGLGIRTITYRNKGLHRDDACDMRSMEICDFFHCSCSKENRETDDRGPFIFFLLSARTDASKQIKGFKLDLDPTEWI